MFFEAVDRIVVVGTAWGAQGVRCWVALLMVIYANSSCVGPDSLQLHDHTRAGLDLAHVAVPELAEFVHLVLQLRPAVVLPEQPILVSFCSLPCSSSPC